MPFGSGIQGSSALSNGLTSVDRDAHRKVEGRILPVQLLDRVEHPEAGPHGAFGVVAMRNRGAEHRHHRIANELLHHAAKRFDLRLHPSVIRGHFVVERGESLMQGLVACAEMGVSMHPSREDHELCSSLRARGVMLRA